MNNIQAKNLALGYGQGLIFKNLEIHIPEGKITAIIGPNGCGKSTLLKGLGRILKPQKGGVYLDGHDIQSLSTLAVAQKMSILPQSAQAPEGLCVSDLVAYGRFPHRKARFHLSEEDVQIIDWALSFTKLTHLKETPVDTLSGGQRQRVWIAMAIAQKSKTMLLDEPTTYLDMSYQLEILSLLSALNQKEHYTLVMVLHDINLAARHADHMVALRDGKILCQGSPSQVMKRERLKEIFSIDAEIMPDPRTRKPACVSYDLL